MKDKKYYGKYDEQGYYVSMHESMQEGYCIELTYDQWQEALTENCMVVDGVHTIIPVTQDEITQGKYNSLRYERDKLLQQSDWTQMPDSPITEEKKQEWQTYRQALRNLPQTVDINNIEFPTKPQ